MANRTTDAARPATGSPAPWRDPGLPVGDRVDALVAAMTLPEKLAQLVGLWAGADPDGGEVAPHQNDMLGEPRTRTTCSASPWTGRAPSPTVSAS